jgi:hypothetical protein
LLNWVIIVTNEKLRGKKWNLLIEKPWSALWKTEVL